MRKVILKCKETKLVLELRETLTADIIYNALPLKSKVQKWGDEIYFETGLIIELESDAKSIVNIGEIAFWNSGSAIAIGYGKTPISKGNEIRLISPCNIWADSKFEKSCIENIKENETIILEKI
tara:strand:+ start:2447 stop:2818 length:372 start_codon:yes stop_codon:yes gene_type:complete